MWKSILEICIRSSTQMGRNKAILHLKCVSELKRNSGGRFLESFSIFSCNLDVYPIDGVNLRASDVSEVFSHDISITCIPEANCI